MADEVKAEVEGRPVEILGWEEQDDGTWDFFFSYKDTGKTVQLKNAYISDFDNGLGNITPKPVVLEVQYERNK